MKMFPPHRVPTVASLLFLLLLLQPTLSKKDIICPIGFQITYSKIDDTPICYRLKGPEKLTDKYLGCTGNLYTSKLYNSLNLTKTELTLWTEYKTLYPGGPFIDYSYTKSTGNLLESSFEVYNSQKRVEEDLCIVIDPVSNFTVASCDEEYYRYCLVEPYVDKDSMSIEGCDKFNGSLRFWAPRATCLVAGTADNGGPPRPTWPQAKDKCERSGGTLLYNGWRYSNNPLLIIKPELPSIYPLGVTYDPQRQSHIVNENATTPPAEWGLNDSIQRTDKNETTYGALVNGMWSVVNSSHVFYNVICEKNVELKKLDLVVSTDEQNKLILTVSEKVTKKNISCFTDSEIYYPKEVEISSEGYRNKLYTFIINPMSEGYYWCVHTDSMRYLVSESNKALWIREEQSLLNTFAVKLNLTNREEYRFDNVKERLERDWENKLKEYIYFSTYYNEINGNIEQNQDPEIIENVLKDFKAVNPGLKKSKDALLSVKLKKLYLDRRTVLLHVVLHPKMKPVQPGTWEGIQIVYMKPVHYCKADNHQFVDSLKVKCELHSCVGDFNDGMQVLTTKVEDCFMSTELPVLFNEVTVLTPTLSGVKAENPIETLQTDAQGSDSSEESTGPPRPEPTPLTTPTYNLTTGWVISTVNPVSETETVMTETPIITPEYTTSTPTPTEPPTTTEPPPIPPEEQLDNVMQELNDLLNNNTDPVLVENIKPAINQVDELLEENVDLPIPGQLLQLLDQIGSRLDLDGNENATAIRGNIALLVTNAEPNQPVKGLRISTRENDSFTDDAFQILRENFDDSNLQQENSDAVVQLPDSVSVSSRRISFVVFRNDRAFHPQGGSEYLVNSKVFSVNVENVTQFEHGEYVNIHFSAASGVNPERNQSRSCAYWHFLTADEGYWSQEGCTFIRATQAGTLDTCRCSHLTHFAEVLVPRTVFTEENERALEILSIIGCCLSLFGLVMIGITAALFRSWRRDFTNKIWLQLCISILVLVICFLVIVFKKFDRYNIPCMLVGVLLHYSVLASFCWMLVAAVLSYRRLVMVFTRDASHKLLRASAFSWGVPCAIVGILLSVAPQSYAGQFEEMAPSGAFCYPSGLGLWLAVYAPIAVMLLANWTLFVLIVRSVFGKNRLDNNRHLRGNTNEAMRCASVSCLLVFLFGLPWIFGLFAYNIVLAYLFTLTATFQGFVLFIFFVVGNKKTRDLWFNKLKIKQTRKIPVTSSTYTNNRSTGPGWRGGAQTSVEAKVSKPRSLASPDDSRFS